MSRRDESEKEETRSGDIIRAEYVRGIGRTDEDNMSLSERKRGGLVAVESG